MGPRPSCSTISCKVASATYLILPTSLSLETIGTISSSPMAKASGSRQTASATRFTHSRVVFAPSRSEKIGTWFIVFNDGWWSWDGDIPDGLLQRLTSRDKRADLTCVSLGPSGEWYVSAQNRKAWWGGMDDDQLDIAGRYKDRVMCMVFGGDRKIHIRYE